MKTRGFLALDAVSDERLVEGLKGLVSDGCRIEARVVAHLAELDLRRLHLRGGQSLFEYCRARLGFSDSQAYYRINAARIARQFPIVFELLERHEIHVTALAYIGKYLSEENHVELLGEIRGKTKRQILELIARRFPKADVASEIRPLPIRAGEVAAGPTGTLEPRSAGRYRLQLSIDAETLEQLELARDLMSHANPSGDLAVVVKRALSLLLENLKRQRFGQTQRQRASTRVETVEATVSGQAGEIQGQPEVTQGHSGRPAHAYHLGRPRSASWTQSGTTLKGREIAHEASTVRDGSGDAKRPPPRPSTRRRIASEVRRELLARDGLRCSFVGADGCRCSSRAFLQIHHEHAWAKGGPDTLDNLRLLCAAHNQLLAEDEFGPANRGPMTKAARGT